MSGFCQHCGAPLVENAAFCKGCGKPCNTTPAAPQQQPPIPDQQQAVYTAPQQQAPYSAPQQQDPYAALQYGAVQNGNTAAVKKKPPMKIILPIAGGVCLILIAALVFILVKCSSDSNKENSGSSNSPKGVMQEYINAWENIDYVKECEISYNCNFDSDKSLSEYKKDAEEELKELKDSGRYEDYKESNKAYKFEFVKEIEPFESLEETRARYKEKGYKDTDKITETKTLIYKITNTKDSSDVEEEENYFIKCDGKWYIVTRLG